MTMIDRVVQAVRQNPEGLLLLGAGVALVLRSIGPSGSAGEAPQQPGSRGSARRGRLAFERPDEVEKAESSFGQTLSASVSDAQDAVAGAAQNLGETVSDGAKRLAGGARNSVEDFIDTHPVAVGIAGVAAGCLAAAFLPTSRLETETLSPLGKQAVDALSNVGERVKDATISAGVQLKDAAADRGLNKQGLSDVARDMAGDFKNNVIGDREAPTLAPAGTSNGR